MSTLTYNIADIWEAVSDRVSDREAVVCGDRRATYGELEDRANRFANHLTELGVGPGDFVGVYLTNSIEYIEVMLACFKIRAMPVNINYRYVDDELSYLFNDAGLLAVVCEDAFASRVADIAGAVPTLKHVFVVGEGAGPAELHARNYTEALASSVAERPVISGRGNDDLYVIYTGGTTGMPKGVVWRMEDAFFGCLTAGDPLRMNGPVASADEMLDRIIDFDFVFYALAPLMHAAAQWVALMWFFCGAKVVLHKGAFDPVDVWRTVEREKVSTLTIVGDAMGRPLVDAFESDGPFDTSSLFALSNGGAPLTVDTRERFMATTPGAMFTDGFGSSETGIQGSQRLESGQSAPETRFDNVAEGTKVLDDNWNDLAPGSGKVGRIAHGGYIPLRYHNAPEKTAENFRELDGVRYVLSGDMATVDSDGSVRLIGRGSTCINTGGEKVFPEEVESALKSHPDVYDTVVVGVPDDRWGERVAAVVRPVAGAYPTLDELAEHCRTSLAGYKLPRSLTLVEEIVRSPAGKADYRWAKTTATG